MKSYLGSVVCLSLWLTSCGVDPQQESVNSLNEGDFFIQNNESSQKSENVNLGLFNFSEKYAKSFKDFLDEAKNGKEIRVVVDYKKCDGYYLKEYVEKEEDVKNPNEQTSDPKCKLQSPSKPSTCYLKDEGMDAIGSMKAGTWEFFGPEITKYWPDKRTYVAFSETALISFRGFLLNYGNVRIYDDETVKVSVAYLDKITYEYKMDEYFVCKYGKKDDPAKIFIK